MCNEKPRFEKPPDLRNDFEDLTIPCPKCGGSGVRNYPNQRQAVTCPTCKGTGVIKA